MSLSFNPLDALYCEEPTPLYVPAKLNGKNVTCVMVDPSRKDDVITEETLFVNGWHRPAYDECCTTLRMYDRFSIRPLGSTTLTVLVGPKSSVFIIIPKSDLFQAKIGIPWLISMAAVPSIANKCLKFPHEDTVHVIQDTRYRPLIARGDFFLDHFWPTPMGPILPHGDLMYHTYYQYDTGESTPKFVQPSVSFPPPA